MKNNLANENICFSAVDMCTQTTAQLAYAQMDLPEQNVPTSDYRMDHAEVF